MDLYNIITKIPYIIMLVAGLTVILGLYIGGLNNLSMDIDASSQEEYRKAVVMENLLNLEASEDELEETTGESYSYNRKRAYIPIEFFTNEDPDPGEIGFRESSGTCHITDVTGLDGQNFGFSLEALGSNYWSPGSNPDLQDFSSDCLNSRSDSVSSPAFLVREAEDKPPLEVILYVYPA